MKPDLPLLTLYAELEHDIQTVISALCLPVCSYCPQTSCCCRLYICEEAFDSALLRRLHEQNRDSADFSERNGWLTDQGCALPLGRPPVCYEYFCDELLENLPDTSHRYALETLGKLLFHCGNQAVGEKHLLELRDDSELAQVNLAAFALRIDVARRALGHIEDFFTTGRFESGAIELLEMIEDPPDHL